MPSHDTLAENVPARADVELRLPADSAFASVLRTTTVSLAARLDFTMDDIEDLRIAVGEAGALVLPAAEPGADLVCKFFLGTAAMTIQVETAAVDESEPDLESFAWQVLDTLAAQAEVTTRDGVLAVRFTMRSGLAADTAGVES